jgi:FkbM family methyltransferase
MRGDGRRLLTVIAGRVAAAARARLPDPFYVAVRPHVERLLGLQERELTYLLKSAVGKGRRFVDVGANWGSYSVLLAPHFEHVEAFEPIERCAVALRTYAATRNGHIAVHPCALSDRSQSVSLVIPKNGVVDQSGRSRIVEAGDANGTPVSAEALDSFGFYDIDLVKIDVEGHERRVIAGARETIRRSRPTLLVEIEQRHIDEPLSQRVTFIEALGYRASFVRDDALAPMHDFDVVRDQDETNIARGRPYVNNFLFEPVDAA